MSDGSGPRGPRTSARRLAADRRAPALAGLLLGVLAVAQVLVQSRPGVAAGGQPESQPQFFLILIAVAATATLGLLWSEPRAAATIIAAANLLSAGVPHAFSLAGLAALAIALYRLGYHRGQRLAAAIAAAFALLALALSAGSTGRPALVALAAAAPLAAWAGYARRTRGESAVRAAQSQAMAGTLLEHTARGERARISRELHDVVAHHISMIAVQAETARLTTAGLPPAGAERLSAIGDTARSALTEMRRLLGVLREDTREDPVRRHPQPGLDQLNELLDEARDAAGSGTRMIISGQLRALDPGVELAAFRIIQEALTNARRHAPGAAVDVELRYESDCLYLRVRDNGPGPAPAGAGQAGPDAAGHGLLGMRERASAVGGTLRTGPATVGGFLVEARLPAPAEQAAA
jgi:signal transduction histidine kinase